MEEGVPAAAVAGEGGGDGGSTAAADLVTIRAE